MDNHLPVYEMLKDAARKWPHNPAVYDEYGTLSFSDLLAESEALKKELLALGMAPGMLAGVKAVNSRNFIIGLFAVLGCGAAVMPVYHQLRKNEIDNIIQEARLHALLDDHSSTPYFDLHDCSIAMKKGALHFYMWGK